MSISVNPDLPIARTETVKHCLPVPRVTGRVPGKGNRGVAFPPGGNSRTGRRVNTAGGRPSCAPSVWNGDRTVNHPSARSGGTTWRSSGTVSRNGDSRNRRDEKGNSPSSSPVLDIPPITPFFLPLLSTDASLRFSLLMETWASFRPYNTPRGPEIARKSHPLGTSGGFSGPRSSVRSGRDTTRSPPGRVGSM